MPGEDNLIKKIFTNVANAITGVDQDASKTGVADGESKEPEFVFELADDLLGDQVKLSSNGKKIDSSAVNNKEAKEAVQDMLGKLFSEDGVKKLADKNSDGITLSEAKEYLAAMMKEDGTGESLSLEDIEKALDSLGIDPEKILNDKVKELLGGEGVSNIDKDVVSDIQNEETISKPTNSPSSGGAGGAGGVSGGGGAGGARSTGGASGANSSGGAGGTKSTKDANTENIENMSVEQIQEKITEKQGEITTAEGDLAKVASGEHEEIKALKDAEDAAYKEYQEKVKDELGEEKAKQLDDAKKEVDKTKQAIDEQNNLIKQREGEIQSAQKKIDACQSRIDSLNDTIGELESAISSAEEDEDTSGLKEKLRAAKAEKAQVEKDKQAEEENKKELEGVKTRLERRKTDELEPAYEKAQKALEKIEKEFEDNDAIQEVKEKYEQAKEATEAKKTELTGKIQGEIDKKRGELDELNTKLAEAQNKESERKYSTSSLDDAAALYEKMGLEELGLNKEVFEKALEGYNNLSEEDKATGMLGIFDTTQGTDDERYYLIDLNKLEVVEQSELKLGKGDFSGKTVQQANQHGSNTTLSGFEKISEQYYSDSMGKNALRMDGLEEGINNNARGKGTVVHYTKYDNTLGCKGFPPVYNADGSVNVTATDEKMHKLFPKGSICFTYPQNDSYWEESDLYS